MPGSDELSSTDRMEPNDQRFYPSGKARSAALLIDAALLTAWITLLSLPLYLALGIPLTTQAWTLPDYVTLLVGPPLYFLGSWRLWHASPGLLAMRARIIDAATGARPTMRQWRIRFAGALLSTASLLVGFLAVRRHPRGQSWHDRWAGTVVISLAPRNETVPLVEGVAATAWSPQRRLLLSSIVLGLATLAVAGVVLRWLGFAPDARVPPNAVAAAIEAFSNWTRPVAGMGAAIIATMLVTRPTIKPGDAALALALTAYWAIALPFRPLGVAHEVEHQFDRALYWVALAALIGFSANFPTRMVATSALRRLDRWSLEPRIVWPAIFVIGIAAPLAFPFHHTPGWLEAIRTLFVFLLLWQILRLLRLQQRTATGTDAASMLWLVSGVYGVLVLPFLALLVGFVFSATVNITAGIAGTSVEGWSRNIGYWMGAFFQGVLPVLLTAVIAFAVLYKGALDPRLAIRKTTLYGAVVVIILAVFAALEFLISTTVAGGLGLSGTVSAALAGAAATAAIAPVRSLVKRRTEEWLDHWLPPGELGDAARGDRVVMFSDLTGFTAAVAENEAEALAAASIFHKQARAAARKHRGRVVKTIGDAVMLEFSSARDALNANAALAHDFAEACQLYGVRPFPVHSGIHAGPVVKDRAGDLFGETVNLAARLQSAAQPGETLISAAAITDPSLRTAFELGEPFTLELKNLPEGTQVFRLRSPVAAEEQPPAPAT